MENLTRETFINVYSTIEREKLHPILKTKKEEIYNISYENIWCLDVIEDYLFFFYRHKGINKTIQIPFEDIEIIFGREK